MFSKQTARHSEFTKNQYNSSKSLRKRDRNLIHSSREVLNKVKHIKIRPFKIQIKEKKGKPPPLKSYNHGFSGPAHTGILNVPSFFSISKEQTNYNLFVRWLKEIAARFSGIIRSNEFSKVLNK